MYRLLLTVMMIAILLPATLSLAFAVPPPLTDGNDAETNRVLEQFIWQKIIGAPTDPKKAYQELRSSLDAISQRTDLGDRIRLPESLYMLSKSLMQPRSLRRRSSYASPTSSNETAILSTSETSHKIFSQYNNPATTNKYIPEFGAKELYQQIASIAGNPDKEQPPLPPPPPPPTHSTTQESNNNEPKQTVGDSQPLSNNNHLTNDQIHGQHQEILRKHLPKKRVKSILSLQKYNRKAVKQQTAASQRQSISNQLENEEIKSKQETQQQQQQQVTSDTSTINGKNRGHQQAQSQSIYDFLPMPSYGGVKNAIRPYSGFGMGNYGGNNNNNNNNMMGYLNEHTK
ncbi:DFP2-like protein [Euroglyphus maynei]|uniref:DFP2-like protein n=1 Tax=Euroglyphus maynei TaxID=6958 RepID=A0A1Y3BPS4_EURMA|nr:DFP2-like protein [Euroglyphus maynei]